MALTPDEIQLLNGLADCYNQFVALPDRHPCDLDEVAIHIHGLQHIVMSREAVRQNPLIFAKEY